MELHMDSACVWQGEINNLKQKDNVAFEFCFIF